jgi:hypothetical protein
MRTLLLAGAAIASLTGLSVETANAADLYYPAPGYSQAPQVYEPAPPPNYGPPPAYRPPPRYGYAPPPPAYGPPPVYVPAPQAYGPPPAVAYDDDDEVYAAPPRRVYRDAPVYAERPHYRDCWWEWGQRRCGPQRGW